MSQEKKNNNNNKKGPKKEIITSYDERQTPDHRRVQSTRYRLRRDS